MERTKHSQFIIIFARYFQIDGLFSVENDEVSKVYGFL